MAERVQGGEELLGEGKHVSLLRRDGWEFARRRNISGIVVLVAVTDDDEILLVEQPRPIVGGRTIELPAGLAGDSADSRQESLQTAAQRELQEETGYEAQGWDALTEGPVSPGMTTEVVTLLRARRVRRTGDGGGVDNEDITVHRVPLRDAPAWLQARAADGLQIDPKVYAGLYFANQPLGT